MEGVEKDGKGWERAEKGGKEVGIRGEWVNRGGKGLEGTGKRLGEM